jgi:hypothetical protein
VRRAVGVVVLVLLLAGCGASADDVFSIAVGDCLDDATVADEVTSLPIVACTDAHDSEVFASLEVTGDAFPGADALEQQLTEFCRGEAFTTLVGVPFIESRYDTRGYFPTAESWANGDRELLCTIVDDGGARLTGSLTGVAE